MLFSVWLGSILAVLFFAARWFLSFVRNLIAVMSKLHNHTSRVVEYLREQNKE